MIGRGIGGIDIDMSSPVKPLSLPQSAGVSGTRERERERVSYLDLREY